VIAPPASPERHGETAGGVRGLVFGARALLGNLLARPLASYYLLVSSAGLLLLIGLTMVFSATSVQQYVATGSAFSSIEKQAVSATVGVLAFLLFQRLPVKTYRALAAPALIGVFVLLAVLDGFAALIKLQVIDDRVHMFGPIGADAQWLYVGPAQFQPGELAKIALAVWMADVLARKGEKIGLWRELARPLFVVAGLMFVMVGFADFGTMACLLVLFVGMLWAAGVRWRIFAGLAAVGMTGILGLILIAPYRLSRIFAFLHPERYTDSAAYQVFQGQYAIGNGGWFGVGLGEARTKWGWLPNAHNDFIFAIIAEELGVVGCLVVLALFAMLTYTGLRIARRVRHPFRRYAAAGVTVLIAGQATINIAGVLRLAPVTGLPLPLISDGGSALVVTLAMLGMLASFARAEPAAANALHARPPGRVARLLWAPLPPLPRYVGNARGHMEGSGEDG
jgi:cell division protein FtsW